MSTLQKSNIIEFKETYAVLKVPYKDTVLSVLIDKEDADKVKEVGVWHATLDHTLQTPSFYIMHRYKNKKEGNGAVRIHRLITNCPKGMMVDHINHDTLDNRKSNLRVCTSFENQQNLRSKNKETGLTGIRPRVYKTKSGSRLRWVADITINKRRFVKDFVDKEQAILWRQNMQKEVMPQ